jgi:hypothetical protein
MRRAVPAEEAALVLEKALLVERRLRPRLRRAMRRTQAAATTDSMSARITRRGRRNCELLPSPTRRKEGDAEARPLDAGGTLLPL